MTRARFTRTKFSKTNKQIAVELGDKLAAGLEQFQDVYAEYGSYLIDDFVWKGYKDRVTGKVVSTVKQGSGKTVTSDRVITDTGNLAASIQTPEVLRENRKVSVVVGWDAYYAEQVITGDYIGDDGKMYYRTPRDWVTKAREDTPVAPFIQEQFK